jgi:hypothetical protein
VKINDELPELCEGDKLEREREREREREL